MAVAERSFNCPNKQQTKPPQHNDQHVKTNITLRVTGSQTSLQTGPRASGEIEHKTTRIPGPTYLLLIAFTEAVDYTKLGTRVRSPS